MRWWSASAHAAPFTLILRPASSTCQWPRWGWERIKTLSARCCRDQTRGSKCLSGLPSTSIFKVSSLLPPPFFWGLKGERRNFLFQQNFSRKMWPKITHECVVTQCRPWIALKLGLDSRWERFDELTPPMPSSRCAGQVWSYARTNDVY